MRYIEITHTYVLPVPEEDLDPAELDPVMNAGVSIMERHIRAKGAAVMSLRSDWKIMPKEYDPSPVSPEEGSDEVTITPALQMSREEILERFSAPRPGMEPGQISLTGDLMGQRPTITHPWQQGLRVLPLDHPLADKETQELIAEDMLCGEEGNDMHGPVVCVGVRGHRLGEHQWARRRDDGSIGGDPEGAAEGSQGSIEAGTDRD
jgi:hypothetical protein